MKRFAPGTMMQLAEGTQLALNGRVGEVYRSSPSGCELVWEEYIDVGTGEVISAIADKLTAEQIGTSLARGRLKILALPAHLSLQAPENPVAIAPRPAELARAAWRDCYVSAAQELIAGDVLKPFEADFERNLAAIIGRGMAIEITRRKNTDKARRAGQPAVMNHPPKSAKAVFGWWRDFVTPGIGHCFDDYRKCGRRGDRYTEEERALMREVIDIRLTEERPSIASILESVQARFRVEERKLLASNPDAEVMSIPGYDTVWSMIDQIAPIDHKVRSRGMQVAYRDLHTLGQGLHIDRVLQRVELDEYTVDLMVFMRLLKLDALLTPGEKVALSLTGEPKRVTMSAAIDVYSGAIVAMQIALEGSMNLAVKTIEMIYLDKQPIADAAGAVNPWPMHGHPQTLALDRAAVNMSDEMYLRLAAAGITNLAVPAGKPFLKPWIERFFAGVGAKFLQQFTGRTFSDVVLKGENDPAKRATLTLEDFLLWLVRWIVDVHHTTKPATLGRAAPLYAWQSAVAETPPLILNDESRLRRAFGDRMDRLVSRKGVVVLGLHYIAPEISEWFLNEADRELEVWWWHKKIGRVEVLLPNGKWVTAHCKDDKWADASYADLATAVALDKAEKTRGQMDRDNYRVEADAMTAARAGLRGLLPLAPSAEQLAARTKEFNRHVRYPGSEPVPSADIFDGVVTPFDGAATSPDAHRSIQPRLPEQPDAGDIME